MGTHSRGSTCGKHHTLSLLNTHNIFPYMHYTHVFQIYKRDVDRFTSGRGVQSCQIDITWEGEDSGKVKKLRHKMELKGAGKDCNYFNIISPSACTS